MKLLIFLFLRMAILAYCWSKKINSICGFLFSSLLFNAWGKRKSACLLFSQYISLKRRILFSIVFDMKIDFEIYLEMRKISNNYCISSNLYEIFRMTLYNCLNIKYVHNLMRTCSSVLKWYFIHIRAFTCSNASKSRNVIKVEAYSH